MTLPRIFLFISLVLFGAIGLIALTKRSKSPKIVAEKTESATVAATKPQAIEINLAALQTANQVPVAQTAPAPIAQNASTQEALAPVAASEQINVSDTPDCDRIELLFQKNSSLPIVQTIQYKSKVAWKKGRSAWLVDYAAHYKTHLHFIARSMNGSMNGSINGSINGKADYNPRPANDGQTFNVLASNINFYFYILVDLARCKLMLYAVLPDAQERILLKTYRVGLGRIDSTKASGTLTPIGKYSLGSRIAVYQPKMMGTYRGKRVEMITVFGTRWIPFEKELANCSEPAKSYGIHGTPWHINGEGRLVDNPSSLGKYESDGCIRMRAEDIEEVFAVVATHETVIEIVSDFSKATLPGKDKM